MKNQKPIITEVKLGNVDPKRVAESLNALMRGNKKFASQVTEMIASRRAQK